MKTTIINGTLEILYNETILMKIGHEVDIEFPVKNDIPMKYKIQTFRDNNQDDKNNNIEISGHKDYGNIKLFDLNEKRSDGSIIDMPIGKSNNKQVYLALYFTVLRQETVRLHIQVSIKNKHE